MTFNLLSYTTGGNDLCKRFTEEHLIKSFQHVVGCLSNSWPDELNTKQRIAAANPTSFSAYFSHRLVE